MRFRQLFPGEPNQGAFPHPTRALKPLPFIKLSFAPRPTDEFRWNLGLPQKPCYRPRNNRHNPGESHEHRHERYQLRFARGNLMRSNPHGKT